MLAAPHRQFHDARDATTEPLHAHYQYVIIGGGTAGCALAATLAEGYKVLLLERGGTPYGDPSIERLEGWADIFTRTDERAPAHAFRSADGVHNRRARVLGGGSAINVGFYGRASDAEVRAAGWEPEGVREAYKWVEDKIVHPVRLGPWQTALKNALVQAGITPDHGRTREHVQGTKVGHSIFDSHGRRHSAADLLSSADASLLTVLTFASAHRIIFDTSGNLIALYIRDLQRIPVDSPYHVANPMCQWLSLQMRTRIRELRAWSTRIPETLCMWLGCKKVPRTKSLYARARWAARSSSCSAASAHASTSRSSTSRALLNSAPWAQTWWTTPSMPSEWSHQSPSKPPSLKSLASPPKGLSLRELAAGTGPGNGQESAR